MARLLVGFFDLRLDGFGGGKGPEDQRLKQ